MITEAINKIEQLVCQSEKTELIRLPGDSEHVFYYKTSDGTLEQLTTDPLDRNIRLYRIEDLVHHAKNHFYKSEMMIAFHDADEIRLIWNIDDGWESTYIKLEKSWEYLFFKNRLSDPLMEVKDLRQALRLDLRAASDNEALISQISVLGFKASNSTSIDIQKGKESFDRAIMDQVAVPGNLPDEIQTFNVRMYSNSDLSIRYPLQFFLEPDIATRRWFIKPLEDSWIDYQARNMQWIHDGLCEGFKGTNVFVYEGSWSGKALEFERIKK
jgi:hypothetical protein